MSLKEAYLILRRYQDWRSGRDFRCLNDSGLEPKLVGSAVEMILSANNLSRPITDCSSCANNTHDDTMVNPCRLKVVGLCSSYQQEVEQ